MAADICPNPALEPLSAALFRRPPAQQAHILTRALTEAEGHGPWAVVRLMARSALPELIQPLIDTMDQDNDSDLYHQAALACTGLGPAAEEALIARWDLLDYSQKIHGAEVLGRVGGEATVTLLLAELPRLRQRLQRKRRRSMDALSTTRQDDLDLADSPTVPLDLRCPDCGEIFHYEVQNVWMSRRGSRFRIIGPAGRTSRYLKMVQRLDFSLIKQRPPSCICPSTWQDESNRKNSCSGRAHL